MKEKDTKIVRLIDVLRLSELHVLGYNFESLDAELSLNSNFLHTFSIEKLENFKNELRKSSFIFKYQNELEEIIVFKKLHHIIQKKIGEKDSMNISSLLAKAISGAQPFDFPYNFRISQKVRLSFALDEILESNSKDNNISIKVRELKDSLDMDGFRAKLIAKKEKKSKRSVFNSLEAVAAVGYSPSKLFGVIN